MQWAVVRDGSVVNIVEADTPDGLEAIYPGCVFEPAQQEYWAQFAASHQETQAPGSARMTKYKFRRRFTMDELVRFDNPELFIQMTPQQRAIANTLMRSFEAATEIDLNDPQLQFGMQLMVDWGLLTPERRDEILNPAWNPALERQV